VISKADQDQEGLSRTDGNGSHHWFGKQLITVKPVRALTPWVDSRKYLSNIRCVRKNQIDLILHYSRINCWQAVLAQNGGGRFFEERGESISRSHVKQ